MIETEKSFVVVTKQQCQYHNLVNQTLVIMSKDFNKLNCYNYCDIVK